MAVRPSSLRSAIFSELLVFILLLYRYNTTFEGIHALCNGADWFDVSFCYESGYFSEKVFATRGKSSNSKGYFATKITRYHNSTFQLERLITSGDISPNPGPVHCTTYSKTIAKNHRVLRCNSCTGLHHIKCGNVKPSEFKRLQQSTNIL